MSRIGLKPVNLPAGVDVKVEGNVCDLGCGARGGKVEGAVRSAPPRDEAGEELTA